MDIFLAFTLASAVIVAIPGPNIMLVIHDSARHGFRKSVMTILGIKAGTALLFFLSLSGLAALLSIFSSLFLFIKWAGVFYLVYLGITQVFSSFQREPTGKDPDIQSNSFFFRGFLVSATNPKGLLFAGAFFPQFLNHQVSLTPQIVILCGWFIILSSAIEIMYAYAGDTTGRIFHSERFNRMMPRISGVFLILFGIGFSFVREEQPVTLP